MANDKILASEEELKNIPTLKDVSDDIIVHCNIKSNAELIARILDYDIENAAYLMEAQWLECYPTDNSLIETTEDITWMCSWCKNKEEQKTNFCPNCGKKMR